MNPRLIAISGPLNGETFALGEGELAFGRENTNGVVVRDRAVSRRHCAIRREADCFKLVDFNSRNGSYVNNVPVQEHTLKHSDRIAIGNDSTFIFLISDDTDAGSASPGVELDDSSLFSGKTVELRLEDSVLLHPHGPDTEGSSGRRAHDLETLLKVCQALDSSHDVRTLTKGLLDLILDLVPGDCGAVLVNDKSTRVIRPVYGTWRNAESAETAARVRVSRTLVRDVLARGKALMCNDVLQDARIAQTESILASPVTAVLVAPILSRGEPMGAIYLAASSLVRPFAPADLQLVTGLAGVSAPAFESARQVEQLREENRRLNQQIDGSESEHRMVGNSRAMREVYRFIEKTAASGSTVLITGENGTGKELVARALHANGARPSGPFVAVNSAAIPDNLLESTLFGVAEGAYTGAVPKKGLLEVANGGTFFLDEIGDLPLHLQPKLLRVIQERQFERVGGTDTLTVDVRIIAATNRELARAVKDKAFREDLYFRLNGLPIHVPPLRERREDIVPLARYFLNRERELERRPEIELSPEAEDCLAEYDWPGNVRQLESVIRQAILLTSGDMIQPADLPEDIRDSGDKPGSRGRFHEAVREAKAQAVLKAFKQAGGSYTETARLLGLNPNYLHRLIKVLKLRDKLRS
jgi:transcriptional regulator with GAF, ATPase, and Fis domain